MHRRLRDQPVLAAILLVVIASIPPHFRNRSLILREGPLRATVAISVVQESDGLARLKKERPVPGGKDRPHATQRRGAGEGDRGRIDVISVYLFVSSGALSDASIIVHKIRSPE